MRVTDTRRPEFSAIVRGWPIASVGTLEQMLVDVNSWLRKQPGQYGALNFAELTIRGAIHARIDWLKADKAITVAHK